ncbi:MAG TPA: protein kinase [Kofleriaceae bacterium]|nr:protein kinase [Kofleriaceae bacterium]
MIEGLGSRLDHERFQIVGRLGAGGMGVVYEALDRERGHRVALKTLERAEGDALYRFKHEFRSLTDISHPNLVTLYDLFMAGESCFFTMELIAGQDFVSYCRGTAARAPGSNSCRWDEDTARVSHQDARRMEAPCDEARLRSALPQLVRGLHAIHVAGRVHRDVKASNVLVTSRGRVVVLDFGLVTDSRGDQSGDVPEGHVVGTIEYMAPEQALPLRRVTSAADWYGLGVMLYEILTGRLPFAGSVAEIVNDKQHRLPVPPQILVPSVAPDLDALCMALLSRDPAERPDGPEILRRLGVDDGMPAAAVAREIQNVDAAPFEGRDPELGTLMTALDRTREGHPAVFLLRGPSGIGKTELVRELIARAKRRYRNLVAIESRCYEREEVPYRAVDPLIDDLSRIWTNLPMQEAERLVPEGAASLARLFPVLARVPALATARERLAIADPQEVRKRGFEALRDTLGTLARSHPVLLFLDDLQWVDEDAVQLLGEVMKAPGAPPILLLLALREDRSGGEAPALARLTAALPRMIELRLGPLAEEVARALAAHVLGPERDDMVEAIAAEAAGVPLFVVELASFVRAAGVVDVSDVKLDDVIAARMVRLSDDARFLLDVVAVAGEPLLQGAAATAARLEADVLRREMHTLRVSKLVRASGGRSDDEVEPYHDRIRQIVLDAMTREDRAATHRRIGNALERERDPSPERLARHWRAANEPERATVYTLRAAREAFDRLDFERAADLYRAALELGEFPAAEIARLQAVIGAALTNAGRPREASDAFLVAASATRAAERLDLQRRSAEQLLRGGYLQEGLESMGRVLAAIGMTLPRSRLRGVLAFLWGRARLTLRGYHYRLRDESEVALEALTRVDVCWSVASGLAIVDPLLGATFQQRGLLMAFRLGERRRLARSLALQAMFFSAEGAARRSQRMLDIAREVGEGDSYVNAYTLLGDAARRFFITNDFRGCIERAAELRAAFHAEFASAGWEIDSTHAYACFSWMYLGQLRTLAEEVSRGISDATSRRARYAAVSLRARLAIVWLVRDDPDGGQTDVEDAIASWLPESASYHVQHFYALHSLCEIDLYRGEAAAARTRIEDRYHSLRRSLVLKVPMVAAELAHLRARCELSLAAVGDRGALRRARAQGRRLARAAPPLARGWGALTNATAARIAGRTAEALRLLRASIQTFVEIDANLYAAVARWRLGELLGGDDGEALQRVQAQWLDAQDVADPARLVRGLAPGW